MKGTKNKKMECYGHAILGDVRGRASISWLPGVIIKAVVYVWNVPDWTFGCHILLLATLVIPNPV